MIPAKPIERSSTTEGDEETADGPILDLPAAPVTEMIARGRERGYIVYVGSLMEADAEEKRGGGASTKSGTQKKKSPANAVRIIARAIGEPDDDGWAHLAGVGSRILGAQPDFDPRSYSCPNLSTLTEKSGGFDFRKDRSDAAHIRRKVSSRKKSGAAK